MSEQQLKDFAEAAERRVAVPSWRTSRAGAGPAPARIAVRSARSRRSSSPSAACVASVSRDDRIDDPLSRSEAGVARELDARPVEVDPDLLPGQRYEVRPWSVDGRPVRVEFEVPGTGLGVARRRGHQAGPARVVPFDSSPSPMRAVTMIELPIGVLAA